MKRLMLVFALQATLLLLGVSVVVGDEDSSGGIGDFADFKDASPAERARLRRGFKDKKDSDKNDNDGNRKPPRRGRREGTSGSRSLTELKGVLRIVVIGNGDMCFVKVFQNKYSYREQYGDTTSTSAFIDLYGHGECEPGATGIAFGFVKAGVIAIAHQIGPKCEAKVTSYAIAKTQDLDPNDGVSVKVGSAAGGEALALCP